MDVFVNRFARAVAEFQEKLLRSLLPREMETEEAWQFLKLNEVRLVIFPDGREELHGFGRKLGDVFCGVEKNPEDNSLHFVTRFTPSE